MFIKLYTNYISMLLSVLVIQSCAGRIYNISGTAISYEMSFPRPYVTIFQK